MSKKANPPPPVPVRGAQVLLALGLAESALAIYQWSELLTLRGGGTTQCGISERINCETVWNSPFASAVHELARMPVAGLGLVWGIVAVALSTLYLVWRRNGYTVRPAVNGLRLTAAAGVASSLVFAAVSASSGALCPTCLVTYGLTLAFAGVAWRGLPGPVLPQAGEWGRTLQWAGGFAVAGYLALLVPGMQTPRASSSAAEPSASAPVAPLPGSLEAYLKSLTPKEQQAVSNALARYRNEEPQAAHAPARHRYGPENAPVKMVEWTDSRCPHCKSLVEVLSLMKKRLPEGKLSLEARQFPLDAACNPAMPPRAMDPTGIRCLAAKAQVCLEGAPDFWTLREKLFAEQATLTSAKVMDILSSGSVERSQLEACVSKQETGRKIIEDVEYAMKHHLEGTPLVVINGRNAAAIEPFLYALIMADGDANAPAFSALPPPQAQALQAHDHPH
jgi:uncharacterized membrane protein/protein-disulfide isomerase